MGRPRKNFKDFITGVTSVPETALEAQVPMPAPTPPAPVYDGPRWDYKFLAGPGYKPANYEQSMDKLGKEGWEFIGVDCYNQNVFRRLL